MFLIANNPSIADKIPKAPCDRIVIFQGFSFFFELKHVIGKSLPFDRLQNHQIGSLLNHEKRGKGRSYVIIAYKCDKCEIYAIRINKLISYIRSESERKSVPIAFMRDNAFLLSNRDELYKLFNINN
jgi:penicillin-binding protein-related factor A (putative recombinase)